jgi:hypothetical protein
MSTAQAPNNTIVAATLPYRLRGLVTPVIPPIVQTGSRGATVAAPMGIDGSSPRIGRLVPWLAQHRQIRRDRRTRNIEARRHAQLLRLVHSTRSADC